MLDDFEVKKLLAGKSTVSVRLGRYVGVSAGFALIDMADQRFPVSFKSGGFVPQVNDVVWVESVDGALYMTGPATGKPGLGVVSTVSGALVTVTTDFGSFTMPYSGTAPTSGDMVGISWSSGPWCSLLSTSVDGGEQPPAPGGGGGPAKTVVFRAAWAGTTHQSKADWWQAQVWAADNNLGAWGYGNTIRDTVPASAEYVSLQVFVNRTQQRGSAPNWALHNLADRSGLPGFTSLATWHPTGNGWQTPPDAASWFAALKAGGSARGVGFNHGGYSKFASLAQDALSGALSISWR